MPNSSSFSPNSTRHSTVQEYKYVATTDPDTWNNFGRGKDTRQRELQLTPGNEIVTLNGVMLSRGTDYDVTPDLVTLMSGTGADSTSPNLREADPLALGDVLIIQAFADISLANVHTKAEIAALLATN